MRGRKVKRRLMAGKKDTNDNGQVKSEGRSASADLDRAIFGLGPSKTMSVGPGDLDRIEKEFHRISKIGD